MKIENLDFVMVSLGLILMVAYHLALVYKVVHHPRKTSIGIDSINRQIWVQGMMEDTPRNGVCAVQTLRNNMMASTLLTTTSIMFTSVIVVLMTNKSGLDHVGFFYGNKSELGSSIKFLSILACIFLALLLNIQSVRYYSDASNFVNLNSSDHLAVRHVGRMVNMGSYFWSAGLRSFYTSIAMFMWLFGPIPMFVCSILLTIMLYFLDRNFDHAGNGCVPEMMNDVENGMCKYSDNN